MEYIKLYREYDEEHSDPRTRDWFMMSSPLPSMIICGLYPILVLTGKEYMKNREPFQINNILKVYNLLMVIWSTYMFYEALMGGWLHEYGLSCQPVDKSSSPSALRMASVTWVFFVSKFPELLDTVFFVMRKKNNQVTFLHVFHHGVMPVTMYFGVRFVPGGHGTLMGLINSFVHIIMYFYYGVSACGPQYRKYLWWKKYITKIQMVQFFVVIVHSMQFFFIQCDYPLLFSYWTLSYAMIFLALFANFYIQEYIKKQSLKKRTVVLADKTQ